MRIRGISCYVACFYDAAGRRNACRNQPRGTSIDQYDTIWFDAKPVEIAMDQLTGKRIEGAVMIGGAKIPALPQIAALWQGWKISLLFVRPALLVGSWSKARPLSKGWITSIGTMSSWTAHGRDS